MRSDGPFARAAAQLDTTASDLQAALDKLKTITATYREAAARVGNIYRNTTVHDLPGQANRLAEQVITVAGGTHQLIAALREAAAKARQGGTP